jgi:putative membrane protein
MARYSYSRYTYLMKKLILRIFTYISILFIVDKAITGFEMETFTAILILAVVLSICHIAINPIIGFLTLPLNFMTFGVFNFLISCVFLYIFKLLIPGFELRDGYIGPFNSDIANSAPINLSMIGVILVSAFLISLFNNIINWTQQSK